MHDMLARIIETTQNSGPAASAWSSQNKSPTFMKRRISPMHLAVVVAFFLTGVSSLITAASNSVQAEVSLTSLLQEMVDRDALARYPQTDFRLKQHSSYNRASTTPSDAKGWFTNRDFNAKETDRNFIRIEENNGQKEWVLMDHEGAGAIVRSWMPWRNQSNGGSKITIRIYLDGASEPVE